MYSYTLSNCRNLCSGARFKVELIVDLAGPVVLSGFIADLICCAGSRGALIPHLTAYSHIQYLYRYTLPEQKHKQGMQYTFPVN
jgi:hypothetical protein